MDGALMLDEEGIYVRHRCAARASLGAELPPEPYQTMLFTTLGTAVSTKLSLEGPFALVWEIEAIYVREPDEYKPFTLRHFLAGNTCWAIVARRRCAAPPRVVGIMLAKDEADIIPDVIGDLAKQLDALYFYAPDMLTKAAIMAASPNPGWARAVPPPEDTVVDGFRQTLLECARRDRLSDGDPRPMWIMVVQGDEIYHDNLREYVVRAHEEHATVMSCQVATFLLHESQREGWDWTQPINARMTHYIWDFGEHTGFLDYPWLCYVPQQHMRAHPHGLEFLGRWARARPIRKHYPFRSPDQARERLADRLGARPGTQSGWQPHYNNYRDVFMGDVAAGRPVRRYYGSFSAAERQEGAG